MLRYLYLLRHAQSADKQTGQTDKERVLTATGLAESVAVGNFLKEKSLTPDIIITSSAVRAKTTAAKIASILSYSIDKVIVKDDLYETTIDHLLDVITELKEETTSILMVGHNPTLSFFMDRLSDTSNRSLHPAELAIIKIESLTWKDIHHATGEVTERFHKIL